MFLLLKTKNSNKIAIVLPHLNTFFYFFIHKERSPRELSSSQNKEIEEFMKINYFSAVTKSSTVFVILLHTLVKLSLIHI